MQDEVNEKVVSLAIKTSKLTAEVLQKAMKALLAKGKGQLTKGFYTLSPKNDVLLRNRYQKRTYIKQGADSLLLAVCALFFYFIRAVLLYPLFGFPIGYTALHSLPL